MTVKILDVTRVFFGNLGHQIYITNFVNPFCIGRIQGLLNYHSFSIRKEIGPKHAQ